MTLLLQLLFHKSVVMLVKTNLVAVYEVPTFSFSAQPRRLVYIASRHKHDPLLDHFPSHDPLRDRKCKVSYT